MKNKKLIAVLTLLCFLFTLMPSMALADTATASVTVNGVTLTNGQYIASNGSAATNTEPDGGYAYFEVKDNVATLTLNNFTTNGESLGSNDLGVIYCEAALTIELVGNNTVSTTQNNKAIFSWNSLTITGNGELTATSSSGGNSAIAAANCITIQNTTVDAIAEGVQVGNSAISSSTISINNATVTAKGKGAALSTAPNLTSVVAKVSNEYKETYTDADLSDYNAGDSVSSVKYFQTVPGYTVTFDMQGHGNAIPAQQFTSDQTARVTKPTDPTADGFTFGGWYTDAACTNAYEFSTAVTDDITLYAKWTAVEYTVTVTNGTIGNTNNSTGKFVKDASVEITAKAPVANQVFYEWTSSDVTFTNAQDTTTTFTMPAKDVTVKATYKSQYTVTFNLNEHGENAPASQTITEGGVVTEPDTDPAADGYYFGGWYKEAACENEWDFDRDTVTEDTILYAKWNAIEYKVWVGGTWTGNELFGEGWRYTPANGDTPAKLELNNYTSETLHSFTNGTRPTVYTGIHTREQLNIELTGVNTLQSTSTENLEHGIYSEWGSKVTISGDGTLNIIGSGGSNGIWASPLELTGGTITVSGFKNGLGGNGDITVGGENTTVTVTATEKAAGLGAGDSLTAANGYVIKAGTSENNARFIDGITYSDAENYQYVKVAKGTATNCTVTFDMNNVTADEIAAVTVAQGGTITAPTNPTAEGYNFVGWYTDENCTEGKEYDFNKAVTGNITLYAKWTENTPVTYKVTFEANGGTASSGSSIAELTNADKLPDPLPTVIKEGYTFAGWYTDSSFATEAEAGATITEDTTLYAKWIQNSSSTPVTEYDVWVGEERVTSANATDVFGDGKVSYVQNTNTLTLNNYTSTSLKDFGYNSESAYAGIYFKDDLKIELVGQNTLKSVGSMLLQDGIKGGNVLTIGGTGSLVMTGSEGEPDKTGDAGSGIFCTSVEITGGRVEISNFGYSLNVPTTVSGENAELIAKATVAVTGGNYSGSGVTAGEGLVIYAGADADTATLQSSPYKGAAKYLKVVKAETENTPDPTPTPTPDEDDKEDTTPSTSTSGGGFSGVYNYPVVAGAIEYADVFFSKNYAVAGTTVTITVVPEAGKQVDTVTVIDKDGDEITATKVGENEYTFTMPASKVTVNVTTEAADADTAADEDKTEIVLQIGSKKVLVNNHAINNDVVPVLKDGRTLVPIRIIVETMGGDVDWDAATRTVTLTIDGKVLKLVIDEHIPGFGQGATIMDNRTYVPIRYIGQYIGADVEWIAATQQIVIQK